MTAARVVREIHIRATQEGLKETEDGLISIADAQENVSKSSQTMARTTETNSRRQISAAGAFDRLRGQIDQQYRAQSQLERGQRTLDLAMQQGLATQSEYNRAMQQLRERYLGAAAANDNFRTSNDNAVKSLSRSTSLIYRLKASVSQLILAYAGMQGVRMLGGMADDWSDMQSRVGAAVKDMDAAPALMQRMVDVANASYSPLSQTVEIYARNVSVLSELGIGADEAADFTESLNHMLVLTATRGERAASVQNALSKAMALGKLQAEGLETVLANGGRVAEALATELGTSVNGLRDLASQGKITGQVIARAIITPLDEVRATAAEMPATVGDAFTRIRTNLTTYIGQLDKASGTSEAMAGILVTLADNLDTALAIVGLLAARISGPLVSAMTAKLAAGTRNIAMLGVYDVATRKLNVSLTAATVSARAFAGIMALVGGPVGAAILGIGAMYHLLIRESADAKASAELYAAAIEKAGQQSAGASGGIREAAAALNEVKIAATETERALQHEAATKALQQAYRELDAAVNEFAKRLVSSVPRDVYTGIMAELMSLDRQLRASEITAEQFVSAIDGMSQSAPNLTPAISEIMRLVRNVAAAMGILDSFKATIEDLGTTKTGKTDRLGAPQPLGDLDFFTRFNAGWGDLVDKLNKVEPAGRAAQRGLEEAERAAKAAQDQFLKTADDLAERMFPGQAAAAEAAELIHMLDEYGSKLTDIQRFAVQTRIDEMFRASALGVRDLSASSLSAGKDIAEAFEPVKDVLSGIVDLLYEGGDVGEKLVGVFANVGKSFAPMDRKRLTKLLKGNDDDSDYCTQTA